MQELEVFVPARQFLPQPRDAEVALEGVRTVKKNDGRFGQPRLPCRVFGQNGLVGVASIDVEEIY